VEISVPALLPEPLFTISKGTAAGGRETPGGGGGGGGGGAGDGHLFSVSCAAWYPVVGGCRLTL